MINAIVAVLNIIQKLLLGLGMSVFENLEEAIAAGLPIWSSCERQGKEGLEPEKVSTIEETSMKKGADK